MPNERVVALHPVERLVQALLCYLPCHERAVSQVRGHQCLSNPADRACQQHRAEAFDDGGDAQTYPFGGRLERVLVETEQLVFGDAQNGFVHRVGGRDWDEGLRRIGHPSLRFACGVEQAKKLSGHGRVYSP